MLGPSLCSWLCCSVQTVQGEYSMLIDLIRGSLNYTIKITELIIIEFEL